MGLLSKERGFISAASNLILFTIPWLCFLASDFLGVLFLIVVVGSCCCSCCSLCSCSKNFLIELTLFGFCCCFLLLFGFFVFIVVVLLVFFSGGCFGLVFFIVVDVVFPSLLFFTVVVVVVPFPLFTSCCWFCSCLGFVVVVGVLGVVRGL